MSTFNAKRARANRPCPIWIDAFLRKTQHLGADEVGAYLLILMAMWSREDCDFPDDDSRLAKVCRVSLRLWRSRIGPVIRPFFDLEDGALVSKRLREEATFIERQVQAQSDRKRTEKDGLIGSQNVGLVGSQENAEKSDNPTENIECDASVDDPRNDPRHHPSQLPNYPTVKEEEEERAHETSDPGETKPEAKVVPLPLRVVSSQEEPEPDDSELLRMVMQAAGLPEFPIKHGWMPTTARLHVGNWRRGLGLTAAQIVEAIRLNRASRTDDPPNRPSAFDRMLAEYAAALAAPLPTVPTKQEGHADRSASAPPATGSRPGIVQKALAEILEREAAKGRPQ